MDSESARFTEFYETARDNCLRAVYASVGDRHAAEDLVAEAFARAWSNWRTVRRHPAPQAWVVRTALNTRVSWWRRVRREIPLLERTAEAADYRGGLDHVVDPNLMAALMRLPSRQREVVALRLFLDLDTGQAARTLRIAPGTVRAHLARAIATLRTDFGPTNEEELTWTTTS